MFGRRFGLTELIPVVRLFYGEPSPIRFCRTDGIFTAPGVPAYDASEDVPASVDIQGFHTHVPVDPSQFCLSCLGGQQGCPIATVITITAYHETLIETQDKHRSTRFAALADDTYMNDTPSRIYSTFDTKQKTAADATKCGVSSALSKVIVTSPSGDYTSTPSHLKTAPGLKIGGAYIGDEEWCASRLSEALSSRLSNQPTRQPVHLLCQ